MVAMILEEDVTALFLFNIDSTPGKVLLSKSNGQMQRTVDSVPAVLAAIGTSRRRREE
jgi:hypothetical protein